ncbi:hypothetical protein GQ85_25010 [Rhodococcus rhodochrous]|nr:hypothetical protein GQ85_25010 [Rhodococcus rhodochrous]
MTRPAGRHGCHGQPSPFHPGSGGNDRTHRRGGGCTVPSVTNPAIIAGVIVAGIGNAALVKLNRSRRHRNR